MGGVGGAHLKKRDQITNVRTIRYASSAGTQCRVSNLRTIKLKLFGTTFNGSGNFSERPRREALGGLGGMPLVHCPSPPTPLPPRKFLRLKALKRHSQHPQSDSCVNKVPRIDSFLFNFDKKSVVIGCIA